jgi:hypothetical protein
MVMVRHCRKCNHHESRNRYGQYGKFTFQR